MRKTELADPVSSVLLLLFDLAIYSRIRALNYSVSLSFVKVVFFQNLHLDKGKLSAAQHRLSDTEQYGLRMGYIILGRFFNYMRNEDFSLAAFGSRERFMAGELLLAWSNETWASDTDHLEDDTKLEFNPNSGYVYLVDEDFNVVMLNSNDKLENWLYCFDCGTEGFRSDVLFNEDGLCSQCATTISLGQENVALENGLA